ncbi:MAG: class I SAM-dependent methyltransferase [Leptospirales bacterium]
MDQTTNYRDEKTDIDEAAGRPGPHPVEGVTVWNPAQYERAAGFVAGELGADLIDWVGDAAFAGRSVLDLGCGDGDLSRRLLDRGAGVFGVDSSAEMIAAARARGIQAIILDARDVGELADREVARGDSGERDARKDAKGFAAFDTVFTNATLHWIAEKDRVVAGVRRVLKPGGVFAGEFGGGANVGMIQEAVREANREVFGDASGASVAPVRFPWFFITDSELRGILEAHGFRVDRLLMFERRPVLPQGVVGWLETFGSAFFSDGQRSPAEKRKVWELAQAKLKARLFYDGVWHADYVRLRFCAVLAG